MFEKQPHYKEILDSIQTRSASISKINSKAKGKSLKHFSLFYPNLFLCLRGRSCSIILKHPHKYSQGSVFTEVSLICLWGLLIIERCLKYWKYDDDVDPRSLGNFSRVFSENVYNVIPRVEKSTIFCEKLKILESRPTRLTAIRQNSMRANKIPSYTTQLIFSLMV